MPKLIKLLLLFFCIAINTLQAQKNKLADSLEKRILVAAPDTNKVKLLIDLAREYSGIDSAKAIKTVTEALKLATRLNYINGQIDANNSLGIFYLDFANPEKALPWFRQVEQLETNNNKEFLLAKLYSNMGNLYSDWHKSSEAISYYNKSLELGQKFNNKKSVAITYNNLGTLYVQTGDLVKATGFLLKGLAIREEIKDQKGIANVSANLSVLYKELKKYDEAITYAGNAIAIYKQLNLPVDVGRVYVNLGLIANRQKKYTEAEKYYEEALQRFKSTTYTRGLESVYNNLGLVLKNQNKTDKALENYTAAYQLALASADKQAQAIVLNEMGDLALMKNDFALSEKYLLQALKLAEEINYLELEKDANETLANLYKQKADYEKAYVYQVKFNLLSDSILAKDKVKIIEDVKGKYETEKKELKITVLSKSDSIKSLQIDNQQIAIIDNLLKIINQKLELSTAGLHLKEDSMVIKSKEKTILQKELDAKEKEQRITLLSKEKKIKELQLKSRNNVIAGISVFTLLLALSGYLFYQRKQVQQKSVLQQEIFKQQGLAMQGILEAEEKERKRIASDLHDGVGQDRKSVV